MDLNVYAPFQSLQKSPITVGGMCSLTIFKIEDVQQWPDADPLTGIIQASIAMKPGKLMYIVQAADKGRLFEEELKYDNAGPYLDMQVEAMLGGHNSANALSLATAQFSRWGIIVADRNGNYRLIGNQDSGAKLVYKYTTGDNSSSRKVNLSFTWQSPLPAPLYQASLFIIIIGGILIQAATIKFLIRFQVGATGAPMNDGDTVLTDARFANKKLLVLIDGVAIPCDDGTGAIDWTLPQNVIRRHYEKTLASNTCTFVGGVVLNEIIEIYEIS